MAAKSLNPNDTQMEYGPLQRKKRSQIWTDDLV